MKIESSILGVGHDLVDIPEIEQQLATPGTRFSELFSARERRQAQRKSEAHGAGVRIEGSGSVGGAAQDCLARHLAACWAGKECVVKAWTEALGNRDFPLSLDEFEWSHIEILSNSKGCPAVVMSPAYSALLTESLGSKISKMVGSHHYVVDWKISLTHSNMLASGVVLLCLTEGESI